MTEHRGGYADEVDPLLEQLAQRLEGNAQFMACVLAKHRRQEGKSHAAQQEMLGVDRLGFVRLALCRKPAAVPATFRAHVEKIARYTGADLDPLVQLIRRVDAVESMELRGIAPGAERAPAAHPADAPVLRPMAAARDRLYESQHDYSASSAEPSSMPPNDANPPSHQRADETERPAPGRSEDAHENARDDPPESPEDKGGAVA